MMVEPIEQDDVKGTKLVDRKQGRLKRKRREPIAATACAAADKKCHNQGRTGKHKQTSLKKKASTSPSNARGKW